MKIDYYLNTPVYRIIHAHTKRPQFFLGQISCVQCRKEGSRELSSMSQISLLHLCLLTASIIENASKL